ncbi:MAG: DctP family TRAP transporter solute-binding subunit [Synergistaceae bacterium]|jgi:C4-dicarboxylate-binding protein DctP|nr:DctP family TRAP transporter solute-binding subunit [Synergistaceae bacterium]
MKKCRGALGFVSVVLLLILGEAFLSGAAEAKTEFRLSNQFPPSHHISKGLVFFADKVREYSGGNVECKIFDSAQLYKDTEIVEALQDALVDTGLVATNKWSGMIPAIDIFEMPFVFRDLSSPQKFLDAGAAELLDKEFESRGVKNLFWVDYGYVQFFNNKRPLTKPSDMKGLTMRSFSGSDAETLQALGAAPTVMSSSEMYMALQRGTVDGATTGMPAAVSRKIHEVQKYMTLANYTTAQFAVQANLEWWNSLSAEEKDVILKAGRDAEEWIRGAIADSENEAQKVIADSGVEIYVLNETERKEFQDATLAVRDSFAQKTGDIGKRLLDMAQNAD